MSNHNTPFSKGAIKGMLTDMVVCIKELLLEGIPDTPQATDWCTRQWLQ